jgi:hypothetical protein
MRRPHIMWLIPALIGLLALVTIHKWLPDPLASYHADQARRMEAENDDACSKFITDREQLIACSAAINLLRQRDRDEGAFL